MGHQIIVLLATLCVVAAAAARGLPPPRPRPLAGRSRALQQGGDCSLAVPRCTACRQQYSGAASGNFTVTRTTCTRCEAGYVPKSSGRACW